MASTDGQKTLVEKITAIANAIRGKTTKTDQLSMDDMVNEINEEWKIQCFVKDFYIRDDGTHYDDNGELIPRDTDWDDYFNLDVAGSGFPALLSYTTDGKILLTASTTEGSTENIDWVLAGAPDGISITKHEWDYSASPTGDSGNYQSCILHGISQNCNIALDCGIRNTNKDNIIINIYISYNI